MADKQVIPGPERFKDKACRFCGYCVFGAVYECGHSTNIVPGHVDLIQGTPCYRIGLYTIRTADDFCGVEGKWFKKRSELEDEWRREQTRARSTNNKPTIDEL